MIDYITLIQVDATIITGLIILLSISVIWSSSAGRKIKPIMTIIRGTGLYLTPNQIFFFLIPFALSAIFILIDSEEESLRVFAVGSSVTGFFVLIGIAVIVGFGERKKDLDLGN